MSNYNLTLYQLSYQRFDASKSLVVIMYLFFMQRQSWRLERPIACSFNHTHAVLSRAAFIDTIARSASEAGSRTSFVQLLPARSAFATYAWIM